jgi:Cytidylate kinase-like family
MDNYVITIARGFGSGGKEIALKLAEELGIVCYENRILTLASELSGLDEELFAEVNEKMRRKKLSGLLKSLPRTVKPKPVDDEFVSDERLFEYQKEIILHLAETQSCIIVGKCADWVLKEFPNVISIYIEAPREFCVQRVMKKMGVNEETAHTSITKTDQYRAAYYQHYTGGNYWTNPVNYDMTLFQ